MRNYLLILTFFILPAMSWGQITLQQTAKDNAFPLVSPHAGATICYDKEDFEVVKKAALLLSEDIRNVSGRTLTVSDKKINSEYALIIGTIGHNAVIDKLIKENQLDASRIQNGWEQYMVKTLDAPLKGVKKALVIAGCDRRGTAYGVFSLSEAIGVTPLYWWSDVPVKKSSHLYVSDINYASKAPSVQYRGIFINDEGWGITPWAGKTFDKELGDIGPKT